MLAPTRVFVSATSGDLASARKDVRDALLKLKCLPTEQTDFEPDYRTVDEMLRQKIGSCRAVIHIVGFRYGGEPDPDSLPDGVPRRSWTQREYDVARELGKKVYVFLCNGGFDFGDCAPEPDEMQERQRAYREELCRMKSDSGMWNEVASRQELRERVREIPFRPYTPWQLLTGVAALIVILGGVIWGIGQLGKKVDETKGDVTGLKQLAEKQAAHRETDQKLQQRFAERFLENLIRDKELPVEEARKQALSDLPGLTGLSPREIAELIDGRIRALAKDEGATPLERARAKLTTADYDGVLAEAAQQRSQTRELEMLAGAAALAKFREDPRRQWNEQAAAAFLRAVSLSDAEANPIGWAHAAIRAAFVLDDLAQFNEAERLLRRAHTLREATLGPDAPGLAIALNNLAMLLKATNRLVEAEPLMRRALAIDERSYGPDHPEVSIDLNNLAELLLATNRLVEAEPLYRRALAIDERSYGPDHPTVANLLNNLAELLRATNRLVEAEPLYRRALAIDERSYGPDHPKVARDLNNPAQLLQNTNRVVEAEPLYRRALAIDERSYGPDHPRVATCLNNLALLLYDTNRQSEAEPLYRRALAIDERLYGPDHPDVARDLDNLALLLYATNRVVEAEPLMRRALAIDERSYGPDHPKVANRLNNLAQLQRATNRLVEAEPLMRRALAIDERSYGPDHPDVSINLNNLAGLLLATNRLVEAEPLYRRALAIDERSYGPDHPTVANRLSNLAQLLRATNRLGKSEPLSRRDLEILVLFGKATGHVHPDFRAAQRNYTGILRAQEMPPAEIRQRLQAVDQVEGPLRPIQPEVERLLGPAKPVEAVLAALDEQYRSEGRPPVYFLEPDQPIAPHLDRLLVPTRDGLSGLGGAAYRRDANATAVVLLEAAAERNRDQEDAASWSLTNRMTRGISLRDLGALEQARDDLKQVASDMKRDTATPALVLGCCHYHLALCEFQLNELDAAKVTAAESLKFFDQAPKDSPVPSSVVEESRQLLAALDAGEKPPPRKAVDVKAELQQARARLEAGQTLATLPLDQRAAQLLDQILGPARSTDEVLAELDRQYQAEKRPPVYFLSLDKPIAPHLDELLGPSTPVERVLDSLDAQYRREGRPDVWFLPLDKPIAPHLDELLGPPPEKESGGTNGVSSRRGVPR